MINHSINKIQLNNRKIVRSSIARYHPEDKYVIGHIFESDGCYRTYYLHNNLENIARFIRYDAKDKLLCNSGDYAIVSTMGDGIDIVSDDNFLKILIPVLATTKKHQKFSHEM